MSSLRWAIFGTGEIARKVAPLLAQAEGNTIAAVCSRDATRAKNLATELDVSCWGVYDDVDKHASWHDSVDAVYLTLPNRYHPDWAMRLLDRGLHVLCEKPLCWTKSQAEALFAAAERSGCILVEGFMYLHHPQTAELARIARDPDGPIGPLQRVEAWFESDMHAAGREATRYSHALAGGTMMDVGCYPISFIRTMCSQSLCGDAVTVFDVRGSISHPISGESLGVDEHIIVEGALESGVTFGLETCINGVGRRAVRLTGAWGTVSTDWPWSPDPVHAELTLHRNQNHPRGEGTSVIAIQNGGDKFINQFKSFAAAARGECLPHPSPAWSIDQAASIERVLSSVGVDFDR